MRDLKKSNDQTNIDKYRVVENITEFLDRIYIFYSVRNHHTEFEIDRTIVTRLN